MADETGKVDAQSTDGAKQTDEGLQNLKSEFNRKVDNVNTKVDSVLKATQALITQINNQQADKRAAQTTPKSEKSLNDLLYDDPEEYTRVIEERAEKRVNERIAAEKQSMEAHSRIVNKLINDYPELNDTDSSLSKRAAELLQEEENQTDPRTWRTVVLEAAQELGVTPRAKREAGGDFSMGSSGTTRRSARERAADDELPQETLTFGKLLGLDVNDPKVQKRLKDHAKRNWTKYQ